MNRQQIVAASFGTLLLLTVVALAGAPAGASRSVAGGSGSTVDPPFGEGRSGQTSEPAGSASDAARPAAAPTLSVAGISPSAIALSWTTSAPFGFSNYSLASSTSNASGPWQVVAVLTTDTTSSWSTASLTPGAALWWQVTLNTCVILCGSSPSNVVASVQPSLGSLNYTLPTGSSAEFNWTNNATYGGSLEFVSYGLYEEIGGAAPNLVASLATVGTHSFTATGLSGGLGYTFYLNTTACYSGCGTGSSLDSISPSNAVTFGVAVTLSASVSEVRAVVDTDQSDLFSCNPSGGTSPYTFAWDFGNGTSVAGTESEAQTYLTAGAPTIHCTVTDAASAQATSATSITVNSAPQLNLSANATAADVGQPIEFTATPTLGTPTFSLSWTMGDGGVGTGTSQSHAYASAGRVTVTCSATDATTTTVVRTLSLVVSPALAVSSSASATAAAPGTTLTFTASEHNGSGTIRSYAWTFGDGSHGAGATTSHAYSGAGAFNATVVVTDSNGASNRSVVRLAVSPIAVRIVAAPTSGTTGQTLAFNASAAGGAGGPYNYSWTFGDGSHAYGAAVEHRFPSAGTYHPTLVVTDRLGATNASTLPSLAVSVPSPPPPLLPWWAIALLAIVAALLIAILLLRRQRRRTSAELRAAAPWAPPTDPSRTLRGRKNCPTCGASNLPIRETCESCGADLPRRTLHS